MPRTKHRLKKLEQAYKERVRAKENQEENKSLLPDPQPKQLEFLNSEADIVLCGGGAGG